MALLESDKKLCEFKLHKREKLAVLSKNCAGSWIFRISMTLISYVNLKYEELVKNKNYNTLIEFSNALHEKRKSHLI